MAQQTTVRFIDDLDGSDASGTFDFSLEDRDYQIDLSDENTDKLHDALAPFIDAARKAGGARPARGRDPGADAWRRSPLARTARRRRDPRVGAQNGHQVNDRGRIPKSVIEAYQAAS